MTKETILTTRFISDIRKIIDGGIARASEAVANTAILTYWNIGKRIVEEEQNGQARAQYGRKIIPALAESLKNSYGGGYGKRNLAYYRKFYLAFPDPSILHTCVQNLSWSHIRILIHVEDEEARLWYMKEASAEMWGVRTLERNVTTQYYGRRLASQREHLALPAPILIDKKSPEEYIKNPIVAEFVSVSAIPYLKIEKRGCVKTRHVPFNLPSCLIFPFYLLCRDFVQKTSLRSRKFIKRVFLTPEKLSYKACYPF